MSVSQVAERSAAYALEAAMASAFGSSFDLLATAPQGVAKLRELILSLAVRGKLVDQWLGDEPAIVLTRRIKEEKAKLIAAGEIKREKSRSPIADDELPYELPEGWQWIRLGELLTKIGAGSTPRGGREVYTSTGVKFLRSQNVWNNGLALNGVAHIPKAVHERMSGTTVVAGDLLFNITGASIGRCALVPDDFDEANVSQHVTIVRVALAQVRQFLHLVLISPHVQQTVMDVQVGVSREGLSIGKLGQFVVPLPPLEEQSRIVARVEELMQLCDALEAHGRLQDEQHARLVATLFDALAASESPDALADNWQRIATHFDLLLDRPEAVDTLEQTLLQLAVRGLLVPQDPNDEAASQLLDRIRVENDRLIEAGLSRRSKALPDISADEQAFESPSGWQWARIDDYCEVQGGIQKTPLRRPIKNHFPYLRVANVQRNALDLGILERYELSDEEVEHWRLRYGDLLVVEGNGSEKEIGRCAIWRGAVDPCVFQNHLIRVRPLLVAEAVEFLQLFLNSTDGATEMKRLAITTSGLYNLSVGKIRNLAVPVPPLAEQHRILARVEQLRRFCADLRDRLQESRVTQSQLADALASAAAAQPPAC